MYFQITKYPVMTLILYYGQTRRWDKPMNLLGCFEVPEEFRPFVNDYKINLFEIAYLEDEQVNLFRSDFRIAADHFAQIIKNRDYVPKPTELHHVQETLQLLSVMTKDRRFIAVG